MRFKFAVLPLVSILAGVGSGLLVCESVACRDAIGRYFGRGRLIALADGCGIYETDVERAAGEFGYRDDLDNRESNPSVPSREQILSKLAANAVAHSRAAKEEIPRGETEREPKFLRAQFRDQSSWTTALRSNALSERLLGKLVAEDLKARRWIRRQIDPQLQITTEQCRQYYQEHRDIYAQPVRLRVSHLFLAAPPESAPEIVDAKQRTIDSFSKRIREGESFSDLVASNSEDEATKMRGGDLGFFSAYRMPADFFAAAARIPLGQISQPVRTALGFHIIQAVDLKPARQMTFGEVRDEIASVLGSERRLAAVRKLDVDLGTSVRSFF
jgi:parvulin-like peptidyl-prolyl isomerase